MLTPNDIERIESAIAAAERETQGEIVVAEVDRSSDYLTFRLKVGIFALLLAEAVLALLDATERLRWHGYQTMALQWAFAATVFTVASRAALLRRLLPKRLRVRKVHARALQKFLEHNVHATRQHTGVLILLSCLEQRVEILVDKGALKVPVDFWTAQADRVAEGVRRGQPAAALVEAIGDIGRMLATHLPSGPGDNPNELSNRPRR